MCKGEWQHSYEVIFTFLHHCKHFRFLDVTQMFINVTQNQYIPSRHGPDFHQPQSQIQGLVDLWVMGIYFHLVHNP